MNNDEDINKLNEEVKDLSEEDIVKELNDKVDILRRQRQKFEKRWFIADRFTAGNHFDVYDTATDRISERKFGNFDVRPIHLAVRSIEGIVNNLLASDPKWKIYPLHINNNETSDERIKRIKTASSYSNYFDILWDAEEMRSKCVDVVYEALNHGFGVMQVYWEGRPKVRSISTYDILFDATVKNIQDSSIIAVEYSVPIEEIKNNPSYYDTKYEIHSDNKLSGSSFREARLNETFSDLKELNKTAIVREVWKKDNINKGWNTFHICQNKLLFDNHYDFKKPPFISYTINPSLLLNTSWLERLIPLNRSLDITLAQIEQWVRVVSVGRMLRRTGVKVDRITNKNGEFVDVDGPLDSIQWLQTPEIGNTPFNLLSITQDLMTTIGATTVSVGRLPKGSRLGYKMVESLKASEMSSIQHAVRSFEDFLEGVAEVILVYINNFAEVPFAVSSDKYSPFELVGKNFADNYINAIPVSDTDFGIDVKIESGLAYTQEGRKETAIQLYQLGLIDGPTALDLIGLGGDVREVAQKGIEEYIQRKQAGGNEPSIQEMASQLEKGGQTPPIIT